MMSTLHAVWVVLDLLCLFCSLVWAMRIRPRSATYQALLQVVTITIVQAGIASLVWGGSGSVPFWSELAHLVGFVTFGSTLFPLMQLFSVLRPKSTLRNFEA